MDVVSRMDELGRERSGIEWRELKVITLIFTAGTVAPTAKMRLHASRRCTRVRTGIEGARRQHERARESGSKAA